MEILSVSEVNKLARTVLEEYTICIYGEISELNANSKYYFIYFTLKDKAASISCVIEPAKIRDNTFPLETGITIRATGTLSIYEPRGTFQFKADKIEKDGEGDLQAKIEATKKKLQEEGLFDLSRKRLLPTVPYRIAVLASKDSAAWKDFYKIISEQYPLLELLLYDVLVQGDRAVKTIIAGLAYINTLPDIDVIVITRGGGSLEDLMAFNDEQLARAIAASHYPVVSAIGHEKDTSISDLVADVRASTPTHAAASIVPSREDLYQLFDTYEMKMTKWVMQNLKTNRTELESVINKSAITDSRRFMPVYKNQLHEAALQIAGGRKIYERYGYILQDTENNIRNNGNILVEKLENTTEEIQKTLTEAKDTIPKILKTEVEKVYTSIEANNPTRILNRGYSILFDDKKKIIKNVKQIQKGNTITAKLTDGNITSTILSISDNAKN